MKRFFKDDDIKDFEMENYIMDQLNYYIGWHREDNEEDKPMLATY